MAQHQNQQQQQVQPTQQCQHQPYISFAQYSKLALIPIDEPQPKRYSPEENKRFRRNLIADARRMKLTMQEVADDKDDQQDPITTDTSRIIDCLGLEALINRSLMMTIATKRQEHIASILAEQKTQKALGIIDTERLSRVSQESSNWTCCRAQKLALAYSELV